MIYSLKRLSFWLVGSGKGVNDMQKIKVTKRQHKATHSRNAMVQYSLEHGDLYQIAGVTYRGRPKFVTWETGAVTPGIPFVRVD